MKQAGESSLFLRALSEAEVKALYALEKAK
jgi:hypothetical protein